MTSSAICFVPFFFAIDLQINDNGFLSVQINRTIILNYILRAWSIGLSHYQPEQPPDSRPFPSLTKNERLLPLEYSQLGVLEEHGIDLVDDLLAERIAIVRVRNFRGHHRFPKRPGSTPYKLCARLPGSKAPTALRPTLKTQAKTDTTHERPEQHRTLPNNGQHRKNCDPHVLFWSILINESDPREKRQERERTGKWTFWQLLEAAVLCLIAKFGK